jgi:DNA-binding FadR family transcriptional regulator
VARAEGADSGGAVIRPVTKAYEQVAEQLRDLIVGGTFPAGHRLAPEPELAIQFGVSRATVREALRVLSAQGLIRTAKGPSGGSFVTSPSPDHVSQFLEANIALLQGSDAVSLEQLMEAREILEIPAARLAAKRRRAPNVEALRDCIPETRPLPGSEQFMKNRGFHAALVEASGNVLLQIAAQPIFNILQERYLITERGPRVARRINDEHAAILAAIERGDEEAAEREMSQHLRYVRSTYRRAWRGDRR